MNSGTIATPTPITLAQLLLAREQRQTRQAQLLQQYQSTLICLTINMPGEVKLNEDSILLFTQAVSAIESVAKKNKLHILHQQQLPLITGAEAYWVIADKEAKEIKKLLIELEQQHPLGRMWDIDVFNPDTGTALSRSMMSIEPRACLVCQQPAKACARSQQHSLQDLLSVIHDKITNYRVQTADKH